MVANVHLEWRVENAHGEAELRELLGELREQGWGVERIQYVVRTPRLQWRRSASYAGSAQGERLQFRQVYDAVVILDPHRPAGSGPLIPA